MRFRTFSIAVFISLFLASSLMGCGKPGASSTNLTNSHVTITSINDNAPLLSDVLNGGAVTNDIITVNFHCSSKHLGSGTNPTNPDESSSFDTIIFRSYHVEHLRSDGGPNPQDFTLGTNLVLEPDSSAEVRIVIVSAFIKNRSPLKELRDEGQIVTTARVTFYGEDGYGNDISVRSSLSIAFANYPDE
ncbi:hypothetical protein CSB45_01740 [candidate division KSB3 bacterium]|uniref:Uncharacterized protein n=1 Tax=candidate division KSB3 bacterium TaxID=2044937 RepID=A0A2G6EAN5_9BACT|nr:MAG: hypothetical protein CSB45_01740 [candidate division KSB3 bacterium]PIE30688.1 MAG: hypothetical protein CSA57_01610 [candidate division KSB3 bacterium]